MKQSLIILFSLFFLCGSAQTILQPDQLKEDFKQLKDELQKRNRGLYLFQTEEEFEERYHSIFSQLNEEQSDLEFYSTVKQFLVPVGERHLSVAGFGKKSDIPEQFKEKNYKVFPLSLRFFNDSTAYIVRNVSQDSTIQLPSQILSVNGESIAESRKKIAQYISKDKNNTTWENWEISYTFPTNYFFHVDTTSTFLVEWKDSLNQIQSSELQAVSTKFYRDSLNQQSKNLLGVDSFLPSLRTDYYPDIQTGYLKVGTFSEQTVNDNEGGFITYKEIVKRFFRTVDEHQFDSVIIDLRNNTGGQVDHVKYLLSFIVKHEDEQKLYYTERKRQFWWGDTNYESTVEKRKRYHFDGDVYILTNGGSYSASVMITTFAKDLADATIAGIEAGGRYDGTTAGRFRTVELDNSHIRVRIPEASFDYYVTKNNFTDISPDIPIQPRVEDYFSYSSDYQLQELLRIISRQ